MSNLRAYNRLSHTPQLLEMVPQSSRPATVERTPPSGMVFLSWGVAGNMTDIFASQCLAPFSGFATWHPLLTSYQEG